MGTAKPYHIYPGKEPYPHMKTWSSHPNSCIAFDMYTDSRLQGFALVAYPNRDSTPYKERYNIPEAQTIVRYIIRAMFCQPFRLLTI